MAHQVLGSPLDDPLTPVFVRVSVPQESSSMRLPSRGTALSVYEVASFTSAMSYFAFAPSFGDCCTGRVALVSSSPPPSEA
jgi:hypothetical protein